MDNIVYLRDLVVILAVAVFVVATLSRFKIPSIAGFIFAGVIVGPHLLGVVNDIHEVELLAEVGVALLLFGIGLEMSLERLRRLWWLIIAGGALQMGLSILLAFACARILGYNWNTSLFIGFLISVSSTAIVLRGLESRGEIDAPHGRLTLGILVFQDLCVVPMMMAIPLLRGAEMTAAEISGTLLRAVVIVVGVLLAARFAVPHILHIIARTRQRHLFVTTVLLTCIGIAWLISSAGASLALGAFLAGLIVAGSGYRHQAMADLIPFKDVFGSLFFVSIGMLLNPGEVSGNLGPVLILLAAIMAGKAAVVFVVAQIMRLPLRVGILTAVALAQVGEFSFVLARAAGELGLLGYEVEDNLLAAIVLSMIITPFFISFGPHLAATMSKIRFLSRLQRIAPVEEAAPGADELKDHVIIGGYGFAGQRLASVLSACRVPYVIADLNVDTVREAASRGEKIYFGDVTSSEVLERLGMAHARELVVVINDPDAAERTVQSARGIAPKTRITVRTNYLLDIAGLRKAGANDVVSEEMESAGEIVARVLRRCEIPEERIKDHLAAIRRTSEENAS